MQFPNDNKNSDCSGLNKYLDGELPLSELHAFESHIEACQGCRTEVDLHREIENIPDAVVLPKDFSRVVAATAESQVAGLRRSKERNVTLAIVAGLGFILFALLGMNFNAAIGVATFAILQIGAFLSVVFTFVLNLVFGLVVIVKVAAADTGLPSAGLALIFGGVLVALSAHLFLAGRNARLRHVKR